jgi:hypothetical protein
LSCNWHRLIAEQIQQLFRLLSYRAFVSV